MGDKGCGEKEKKIKKEGEKTKKRTKTECEKNDKLKLGCAERVQKAFHAGQSSNTEKDDKIRKGKEKWEKENKKRKEEFAKCNGDKTRRFEFTSKTKCKETEQKAFQRGKEAGSKKVQMRQEKLQKMTLNSEGTNKKKTSKTIMTLEAAQELPQKREYAEKEAKERQTKTLQEKIRTAMAEQATKRAKTIEHDAKLKTKLDSLDNGYPTAERQIKKILERDQKEREAKKGREQRGKLAWH